MRWHSFELVYVLLSVRWSAREASGRLINVRDVCERARVPWTETEDDTLDQQREAVISGAG